MKTKWYIIISALVFIISIVLLIIFSDPGWRINLYNSGDGSIDQEIASMGSITFNLGPNFNAEFDSYWEKPGSEFLIKDSLIVYGKNFEPGSRLIVNDRGELDEEGFLRGFVNDIIYTAWKLKNPDTYKQKTVYLRGEEIALSLAPNKNSRETLKLKFGEEVFTVDESGDWIKIVSEKPKMRGWVHRYTTTESKEQIEMLKKYNRIPKLITLFSLNNKGDLQGKTIAGHYTASYNEKGELRSNLYPGDCLIFKESDDGKIPKPFTLTGGYTISEPRTDKIYMLDPTGNFESFDIISFK